MITANTGYKLPKALKDYAETDFVTQLKARFIYYLLLAAVVVVTFLFFTSAYLSILYDGYESQVLNILIPLVILLGLFLVCILLLVKGYFVASSTIFFVACLAAVWSIMFFDDVDGFTRLNTVVFVFAALSMVPLIVGKRKRLILLYTLINIGIFVFFLFATGQNTSLTSYEFLDYLVDTSVALLFLGVVGYNINSINNASLAKAQSDLEHRKKAEQALIENEKQLRNLIENVDGVVFRCQPVFPWKMYYVSNHIYKLTGYPPEEFVSNTIVFGQLMNAGERQVVNEKIQRAIDEKTGYECEFRFRRRNGEYIWVLERGEIHYDKDGNPEFLDGVFFDITARKTEEMVNKEVIELTNFSQIHNLQDCLNELICKAEELSQSKEGFLHLVDQTLCNFTLMAASENSRRLIPYNADKTVSFNTEEVGFWTQCLLQARPIYYNSYVELKEPKQRPGKLGFLFRELLVPMVRKGKVVSMVMLGNKNTPYNEQDLKVVQKFADLAWEIIERKRAEIALVENEANLKAILENSLENIWSINTNYEIIYVNEVFAREFKKSYQVEIARGTNILQLLPEAIQPIWKQRYDRVFDNEHFVIEDEIPVGDSFVYVEISAFPIVIDGQVAGASFFARDNTARILSEKELENYKRHLEDLVKIRTEELEATNEELKSTNESLSEKNLIINQTNQELKVTMDDLRDAQNQLIQTEKMASLGFLTAGVAHEINNPINFIYNGVKAIEMSLQERGNEDISDLSPFIDAINTGIDRVINIVKSLNKYSRSDELPSLDCNMHEVLDDCLIMLNNQLQSRVEIIKKYTNHDPYVHVNEGQMHQAFLNILTNALQAIGEQGVITIETRIEKEIVKVKISDTGMGISKENLKHIFDPFFTTKDPGKGTGLGLSVAQSIFKNHNGSIDCTSGINKGTTFTVRLPLKI
jgi:PAS domain S-box-containing protein